MKASRPETGDPEQRAPGLEEAVRTLTREQIPQFAAAVRAAKSDGAAWPADERFWFSGTAGLRFSKGDEAVIRGLWTRMMAGLFFVVTGHEVEERIERPGVLARIDRLFPIPRWMRIEGEAATVLEREMGGEIWLASIGIWNALCAALLGDRLEPALRESLEASWLRVVGSRLV